MPLPKLKESELTEHLTRLPGWALIDGAIRKEFKFSSFIQAIRFVNEVAENAESVNHHPDIDIRYNRVTLALTTHDSDGITRNDVELAASCDGLADATTA